MQELVAGARNQPASLKKPKNSSLCWSGKLGRFKNAEALIAAG